jgi:hypothetical protein
MERKKPAKKDGRFVHKAEVKQMVKEMLSGEQELKIYITQNTGTAISYSGTIVDCSGISAGDTDTTRDGDRVSLKEWTFSWYITPGDSYNLVRCILFQYTSDTALGGPSVTNIIQTDGSVVSPLSYKSIDYVKNIKILYDKVLFADTYHPVVVASPSVKKRFFDHQVQFTGATTRTNGLFALFVSDSSAATHPSVYYYSTVRFTDS